MSLTYNFYTFPFNLNSLVVGCLLFYLLYISYGIGILITRLYLLENNSFFDIVLFYTTLIIFIFICYIFGIVNIPLDSVLHFDIVTIRYYFEFSNKPSTKIFWLGFLIGYVSLIPFFTVFTPKRKYFFNVVFVLTTLDSFGFIFVFYYEFFFYFFFMEVLLFILYVIIAFAIVKYPQTTTLVLIQCQILTFLSFISISFLLGF